MGLQYTAGWKKGSAEKNCLKLSKFWNSRSQFLSKYLNWNKFGFAWKIGLQQNSCIICFFSLIQIAASKFEDLWNSKWQEDFIRSIAFRFLELVTSNYPEYLKLIVSCLDYSSEASFARNILQAALTTANEVGFTEFDKWHLKVGFRKKLLSKSCWNRCIVRKYNLINKLFCWFECSFIYLARNGKEFSDCLKVSDQKR